MSDPLLRNVVPTCHYHPNVETLVSCGRCGKPLCPDCVGHGATGVRCKECLRQSPRALGRPTWSLMARAAALALGVSAALGAGFGYFGWGGWLLGLALGFVVGSAAFLGARRHRGTVIQVIAALAAVAGVVVTALVASACLQKAAQSGAPAIPFSLCARWYAEQAVAAIFGAVIRFRV